MRTVNRDESEDKWDEQRAAQFLGPDAAQKIHELRDKVGEIIVACRDSGNPAGETEIPAPLTDATFVQEFETRLGKRWLIRIQRPAASDKASSHESGLLYLHFVLSALFAIAAFFAAMAVFGFPGPVSVDSKNAARFARRELRSPSVICRTASFAANQIRARAD
jgi:hypothetical protein